MAMTAEWRPGSPHAHKGISADAAHTELKRLESMHSVLTPQHVVKSAMRKRSPIHTALEWDDNAAAGKHRLHQARCLLRDVIVRISDDVPEVPAFTNVRVVKDGKASRGYVNVEAALASADMRQYILKRALCELEGFQRRYAQLTVLAKALQTPINIVKEQLK